MSAPTPNEAALGPTIVLGAVTCGFCAYHFGLTAARLERLPVVARQAAPQVAAAFLRHALGGVFFLAVALGVGGVALGRGPSELGFGLASTPRATTGVLVAALALLPVLYRAAQSPAHWARYPEARARVWTRRVWLQNVGAWAAYLTGYELLFRGLLLLEMVRWTGPVGGTAIMVAIYVLAHLDKSAGEALGCIPMGILFAWLTIEAGSIWPAALLHLGIALASDGFSVYANPETRYANTRSP